MNQSIDYDSLPHGVSKAEYNREYCKQYFKTEEGKKAMKKYYEEHAEKVKQRAKALYEKNKEIRGS